MKSPKAQNLKTLQLNVDRSTLIERKIKAIEDRSARCAEIRSKFKYNVPLELKSITKNLNEPIKEVQKEEPSKPFSFFSILMDSINSIETNKTLATEHENTEHEAPRPKKLRFKLNRNKLNESKNLEEDTTAAEIKVKSTNLANTIETTNTSKIVKTLDSSHEKEKEKPKEPREPKESEKLLSPTNLYKHAYLADQIIERYKEYEKKKKEKSKKYSEEVIPEFKVSDYFDNEKIDKIINTAIPNKKQRNIKSSKKMNNSGDAHNGLNTEKKISSLKLPALTIANCNGENSKMEIVNKKTYFKEINKFAKRHLKSNQSLEDYQQLLISLLRDKVSDEYLRSMAASFREITEKSLPKNKSYFQDGQLIKRNVKAPKTRWDKMLEKIAPYIPEYLSEKLKSLK